MRCLIANDHAFVVETYVAILRRYFSHVDIADNGQAALDLVKSHEKDFYDYIFLDISMPIMDGPMACTRITRHLREKSISSLLSIRSKDSEKIDKSINSQQEFVRQ